MKKLLILSVVFVVLFSSFVLAEDINIVAMNADTIVHNLGTYTLQIGFSAALKCGVSEEACLDGNCKTIISDIPENLGTEFFYTGLNLEYSLTKSYEYRTTLDCEDEQGNTGSKTFSFSVADDVAEDTTPPEFSLEDDNILMNTLHHDDGGYIILKPYISEFSRCGYFIEYCDYSEACYDMEDDGNSQPYVMKYEKQIDGFNDVRDITITLTCEDLSGNIASETVNFEYGSDSPPIPTPIGGGQESICIETDDGIDLYTKGTAAGVEDVCISTYRIAEKYCKDGIGANYAVDCPSGYVCSDGACIEDTEDTEVQSQTQEQTETQETEETQEQVQAQNTDTGQARTGAAKITPETASDKAIEVLKAEFEKVELVEPTQEGETQRYRVTAKRQAKLLGIFDIEFNVEAEVDADTGEVIRTNQPWWAIFAFW